MEPTIKDGNDNGTKRKRKALKELPEDQNLVMGKADTYSADKQRLMY